MSRGGAGGAGVGGIIGGRGAAPYPAEDNAELHLASRLNQRGHLGAAKAYNLLTEKIWFSLLLRTLNCNLVDLI